MRQLIGRVGRKRSVCAVAVAILMVDVVLVGLFCFWAYTRKYDFTDVWIYPQTQFSMAEGQLTEQWGYAKLAVAAALVAVIGWRSRQTFVWGLFMLLVIMLASDSLQLHEQTNEIVHAHLADMTDRTHVDLIVKALFAAIPLLAMAMGFGSLPATDRPTLLALAAPVLALGFWTTVVDFAHSMFEQAATRGRTIADIIEEGGEGLLISAVLIIAILQVTGQAMPRRVRP